MRPILLNGHSRPLTQVKYNHDGDLIFTAAKDKAVNVWFSHNGERLGTYEGHQGAIFSVDSNPDSTLLLTGAADNSIKLWNLHTGEQIHSWETKTTAKWVQFSRDGKYFMYIIEERVIQKSAIYVYELNEDGPQDEAPISVIHPGGSKANVAGWTCYNRHIAVGHDDGSVSLFDWRNGELVCQSKSAHEGVITDLQMSVDGTYFITSAKDKTAKIFSSEDLQLLQTISADTSLNTAALTPDRSFAILGGGQAASEVTTTSSREGKFEARFHHHVYGVEIGRVKGHFGPINTVAVHPKGTGFTTGGEDGYVRIHHFDDDYFAFNIDI